MNTKSVSKYAQIRNLIDSTLVPHTAFQAAKDRVMQCLEHANGANEPICLLVGSESRTGKTTLIESVYMEHPVQRSVEGLSVPVLRVRTPAKPTVKALAACMLKAVGDPYFDKGTESERTERLYTLLRACSVRMIIIDEFQHFYDKGMRTVMHHTADWLKGLVDESHIALVVVGLPSSRIIIEQNEQLTGRFLAPIGLPRFKWSDPEHREEFCGILDAFHSALSRHFDLPELYAEEVAFRCYCATGGLMGYLTKFLRQAVWNAADARRKTITLENLATAHQAAVWSTTDMSDTPNPVSKKFRCSPSDELMARVAKLGTPIEGQPMRRGGRHRGITLETGGEIFVQRPLV